MSAKVQLLHITPIHLIVSGIRKCWQSGDISDSNPTLDIIGEKDAALIRRVIKDGHDSTLEHSLITFDVSDISRALLQELSRHRVGVSPSVESTRYTLAKILKRGNIGDCLVESGNAKIDALNKRHMEELAQIILEDSVTNDVAKYGIVEAYKLSEQISFNFRSYRHFRKLRQSPRAHFEIRALAHAMDAVIPEKYSLFLE